MVFVAKSTAHRFRGLGDRRQVGRLKLASCLSGLLPHLIACHLYWHPADGRDQHQPKRSLVTELLHAVGFSAFLMRTDVDVVCALFLYNFLFPGPLPHSLSKVRVRVPPSVVSALPLLHFGFSLIFPTFLSY